MSWWQGPVQPCPLTSPNANGYVPVYPAPMRFAGGSLPAPAGWLRGTTGKLFVCQEDRPEADVQFNGTHSSWWAYTQSDEGTPGYVSEVFFRGGLADEPDGGLRACPKTDPAPVVSPGPGAAPLAPPPSGTPADGDHDGTPDVDDKCPSEDARARDANLNGCLDLRRLQPDFTLNPDRYTKRVGGRIKYLGVTVEWIRVSGHEAGARISLSCTRAACRSKRIIATSRRRVEFRYMRRKKLPAGVRVTLRVTRPGTVGRGATYTIRRNAQSKREFCIRPTGRKGSCSTKR